MLALTSRSVLPRIRPCRVSVGACKKLSLARDVQSYFDYCSKNKVAMDSKVFKGTLYEFATKHFLETKLNCLELNRIGGAFDNGVDIYGKWNLQPYVDFELENLNGKLIDRLSKKPLNNGKELYLNILVQCKNYRKKINASTIREIPGIYNYHIKNKHEANNTFFFLFSPFPLTKQGQSQIDSTDVPIIHFKLSPLTLESSGNPYDLKNWLGGNLNSVYMNEKAQSLLKGFRMDLHWQLLT